MSSEALDIYDLHREEQVENGTFSETFQIVGGSTFLGVWDKSHHEENSDDGNVYQKILYPRILVTEIPAGISPSVTQIQRVRTAETYTFRIGSVDDEGVNILWLV